MLPLLSIAATDLVPQSAVDFYDANGYVTLKGVFNESEARRLAVWVEEVAEWPPSRDGKWLHHYEQTEHGVRLSRTEGFVSYHVQLGRRLMAGRVPALVEPLLREAVFLRRRSTTSTRAGRATRRTRTPPRTNRWTTTPRFSSRLSRRPR